jgi:hypothetical protein
VSSELPTASTPSGVARFDNATCAAFALPEGVVPDVAMSDVAILPVGDLPETGLVLASGMPAPDSGNTSDVGCRLVVGVCFGCVVPSGATGWKSEIRPKATVETGDDVGRRGRCSPRIRPLPLLADVNAAQA